MNIRDIDYQIAIDAEENRINEDPVYIRVFQREMKDNGYGKLVPDLTKDLYYEDFGPMRIVPSSSPLLQTAGVGPTYALDNDYVLFAKHDVDWLYKGLVFEAHDRRYKIEEVNIIHAFGGVLSVIATLKDVTLSNEPTSVVAIGEGATPVVLGSI